MKEDRDVGILEVGSTAAEICAGYRMKACGMGRNGKGTVPMIHLELTREEFEVLGQVLERALAALELEIQHTDHRDFRDLLKQRRETLRKVRSKCLQPEPGRA